MHAGVYNNLKTKRPFTAEGYLKTAFCPSLCDQILAERGLEGALAPVSGFYVQAMEDLPAWARSRRFFRAISHRQMGTEKWVELEEGSRRPLPGMRRLSFRESKAVPSVPRDGGGGGLNCRGDRRVARAWMVWGLVTWGQLRAGNRGSPLRGEFLFDLAMATTFSGCSESSNHVGVGGDILDNAAVIILVADNVVRNNCVARQVFREDGGGH